MQAKGLDPFAPAGGSRRLEAIEPMPMPPPAPETIRRTGQKVGRNDPCPCGSGKKYKKCCGIAG